MQPKGLIANEFLSHLGDSSLKEEFERMPFDEKVSYLVENLRKLPDELAKEGVEILAKAGETEYAVVLARDKGMIDKAIAILVDAGDFLWAALIAKNAGQDALSRSSTGTACSITSRWRCSEGAISAANALGMSPMRSMISIEGALPERAGRRSRSQQRYDRLRYAITGYVNHWQE